MTSSPAPSARPGFCARLLRAVKQLCVLAILAGTAVIAAKYWGFDRLDEEVRRRVETELKSHYPRLNVSVKSARRVEGKGIEIRGLVISESSRREVQPLVQVDEIIAECDTRLPDFLTTPPQFRRFVVRGMKVRAERMDNGNWNLAKLLPLPHREGPSPPARISEATIEIIDHDQSLGGNLTLRNIEVAVSPQTVPAKKSGAPATSHPPPQQAIGSLSNRTILHIQGTLAGDHLDKVQVDGLLDPVSGNWDLRGAVEGLEFSPRLRAALPREINSLLQPLSSVRGRTHFGFHVTRLTDERQGQPQLRFTIDGQIAEGRVDDDRLPDPLTDVVATIHCDNELVRIEDLSARCGQTYVENLSAELQGYQPGSPVHIHVVARNVDLDRLPVTSLPLAAREAWSKFSPRGRIDAQADFHFDGRTWHPDISASGINLSVLYDKFPYRIGEGTGTIALQNGRLTANMKFLGGGQVLHCTADITNPGSNYTGWIELRSAGPVMLDERLIAALDPRQQAVVRAFHPRGSVSFAGRVERRPNEDQEHRDLTLWLHNLTVQHDKFSYPIDKVTGTLIHSDGNWTFRDLAGRNDSASIVGSGHWLAEAKDGNQLSLTFSATDVPLEDELRLALAPAVQRLWTNLRPRGSVDQMTIQMNYNPASGQFAMSVEAHKAAPTQSGPISIEPTWFRYSLEDLSGDFYYRDGLVEMKNIQAAHGKTRLSTEVTCQSRGDGSSSVRLKKLAVDQVVIDQELLAALPLSFARALSRLNPSGHINMYGSLGMALPARADETSSFDWDLTLAFVDGRLDAGFPAEHISGEARFVGQSDGRNVLTRGELDIASAVIRDVQFTNIQGPLKINSEQLLAGTWAERDIQGRSPRWITATVFNEGQLTLDGQLQFSPAGDFLIQTTLDKADLSSVVADLAPKVRGVTGKVFSVVNLSGTTEGVHTWRGDGQIVLKDAYLYELPPMVSLLQVLSIQRPDRNAFTDSKMDFKIEGDDIEFTHLDLEGDVISLKGKGRLTSQRELDLKFYTQLGRDEMQLPLFRPLFGGMNQQFLLIEVTGPIERPLSRKTAFPQLNENLAQIFPELARKEPAEPAPRLAPYSPRAMLERGGLLPKKK